MIQERLASALSSQLVGRAAFVALKLLAVELPRSVTIAGGLRLAHGAAGLVVHERTIIGSGVTLYQGVTIGRSDTYLPDLSERGCVIVGDEAIIGANAVVLFRAGETLRIGSRAVVGAGSVVLEDIGPGEIWAGMPARRVGTRPSGAGPTVLPNMGG